jgi:hypothetical protein
MATKKTTAANGNKARAAKQEATSTPVRNTALPRSFSTSADPFRPSTNAKPPAIPHRDITHEMIARRAYEISQSPEARSPEENWFRAERELRAGR